MQPWTQFQNAGLIVEWEESDIYRTSRAKLGGRRPKNTPRVIDQSQAPHVLATEVISTEKQKKS